MGGRLADRVSAEDPVLAAIHLFHSGYVQCKQISVRFGQFCANGMSAALLGHRRGPPEPRHLDRRAAVHFALKGDLAQIIRLLDERFLHENRPLLFDRLP